MAVKAIHCKFKYSRRQLIAENDSNLHFLAFQMYSEDTGGLLRKFRIRLS